jgi:hypothetical protein
MITQGAKQNAVGIAGFVEDLNGAIRENPIAAGLVGMGVLWMVFGGSRLPGTGSALPSASKNLLSSTIGGAASAAMNAVGHSLSASATRVGDGARQVTGAVSSGVAEAAAEVRGHAAAAYDSIKSTSEAAIESVAQSAKNISPGESTRNIGSVLQGNLTKTFDAQPLLLGVIGAAIGLGIASAFPSTYTEQQLMGKAGASVQDKVQTLTNEASERAKDVLAEVKHEAELQGFTPASAKDGLSGVIQKVKTIGASVTNTKVSTPS